MSDRTPSELEVYELIVRRFLVDLHTVAVGTVKSYDSEKRRAVIQHGIKREFSNGEIRAITPMEDVPVVFPGGGGVSISWNLQKGDEVVILFCERSMDSWLRKSGIVDPDDYRMHDESDAIAIPTMISAVKALAGASEGLLIETDAGVAIRIKDGGAIEIETGNFSGEFLSNGAFEFKNNAGAYFRGHDLGGVDIGNSNGSAVSTVNELVTAISTATVATMLGPQLVVSPQWPLLINKLTAIKGGA